MKKVWIAIGMAALLFLTACSNRSVSGQGENRVESEGMGQGARSGVQEKAEYGELPVYEYQQKEISVTNGGKKIYGVAYIPETGEQKVPLVICAHGLGANYASCLDCMSIWRMPRGSTILLLAAGVLT